MFGGGSGDSDPGPGVAAPVLHGVGGRLWHAVRPARAYSRQPAARATTAATLLAQ